MWNPDAPFHYLFHKIEEESKAADRGFVKTNCFGGIENI